MCRAIITNISEYLPRRATTDRHATLTLFFSAAASFSSILLLWIIGFLNNNYVNLIKIEYSMTTEECRLNLPITC